MSMTLAFRAICNYNFSTHLSELRDSVHNKNRELKGEGSPVRYRVRVYYRLGKRNPAAQQYNRAGGYRNRSIKREHADWAAVYVQQVAGLQFPWVHTDSGWERNPNYTGVESEHPWQNSWHTSYFA